MCCAEGNRSKEPPGWRTHRSEALGCRLKDGHALHMMSHRKDIDLNGYQKPRSETVSRLIVLRADVQSVKAESPSCWG